MKNIAVSYGDQYNPDAERNPDLDHNRKKSTRELGYCRENIYGTGEYERKNDWGEAVTHQDSRTVPSKHFWSDDPSDKGR